MKAPTHTTVTHSPRIFTLVLLVLFLFTNANAWDDSNSSSTGWNGGELEDNIDGQLENDDKNNNNNNGGNAGDLDCSFRNEISLIEGLLTLKQIVNPDEGTLSVEVTYQGEGWVAFGVSPDGTMPNGEVVIAKTADAQSADNPGKYKLNSYSQATIELIDSQTLKDASFEQANGQTILRFTKLLVESGETTIAADGANTFIFAVGSDNTFGYHGNTKGKITIDQLTKCAVVGGAENPVDDILNNIDVDNEGPPNKSLWITHAILMSVSWAILLPIGIGCSLLRKLIPGNGIWFKLHMFCNGTAFLLMTVAFGLAVHSIKQSEGKANFSENKHRTIGLTIYILAFVQVLAGIFRPHLPVHPTTSNGGKDQTEQGSDENKDLEASDEPPMKATTATEECPKKSMFRIVFEVVHRTLGFGLLGLAWYNLYTGMVALTGYYGEAYDKTAALWGVIGGLSGVILVLYIFQAVKCRMNKK